MAALMEEKQSLLSGKDSLDEELPFAVHQQPRQCRRRRLRKAAFTGALMLTALSLVHLFSGGHHGPKFAEHRGPRRGRQHLMGKKAEELFLSVPSSENALAASRAYATHPHLAGAPEDFDDAKVILELFQKQFGISPPSEIPVFPAGSAESRNATLGIPELDAPNAWIDVYYPIMNTPLDRSLQILDHEGNSLWDADLVEDGDERDPEAAKYRDAVPTWHGLSRGGEVEGQLIYANYGTKEDYDYLVASGANLTGKIVLTRYGAIFRGLKIKGAEDLGAAGVLIYSDPRDDGSVTVENGYEPYPAGPARNPTSVQRGSVQYISVYSGDPSTPGYPAYENATRGEGANIPKTPSLPISWANAQRLLEEIGGSNKGRELSGEVSERKIKLVNHVDTKVTPIWNAMAAIPGHIKNEVVLVGCHRDAWVMGAADPTSGTVSLHEIIRGFGTLLSQGWKPLRTVVFASWDAEEYGLIGSTEYGEDFADWLPEHVVAYLNVDVSVSGSSWGASASPSLAHFIQQTAKEIPHPTIPGKTLWDARDDKGPYTGPADEGFLALYEETWKAKQAASTGVSPLGSGSDYTVFLQVLGIASSDQGFGQTPSDAVYHYHSIYDSQLWQETYADPDFNRHVAVAKHLGLMALRVADSIVLPLNTTQYAYELDQYLDKVESAAAALSPAPNFTALRKSIKHLQSASLKLDVEKHIAEKKFRKILDKIRRRRGLCARIIGRIKKIFHIGKGRDETRDVEEHVHEQRDLHHIGHHPHHSHSHGHKLPWRRFRKAAKRIQTINKKLSSFEKGFISQDGIKDREWYKHLGVAPGKWLGYGATTMPGLTESITYDKNATLAEYEAARLKELIDGLSARLKL
ncbi:hypothetical protein JAAARDRAFT_27999 [Jaapia argillacea MUCL 33604]|uniref:Zn-dependent exopeptidase n=1 Tax=Jaapia argillacea MUCL 33604 TaxID=933084 RepID=A0A067QLH7_9AGAM|nr:hypothetical protein JAAARDRAFT_27999 [Jaapia argillacea MUCL 33604]